MKRDNTGKKGGAAAQLLDPTRSGEDFIGDTTGLTGVTTGSAQKTSRTPNDRIKDENKNHLPGGIMESKPFDDHGRRLAPELYNDEEYDKNLNRGMSRTKAAAAEDTASEEEKMGQSDPQHTDPESVPYTVNVKNASGDDTPNSDAHNTLQAPYSHPHQLGEQAISGSTPDPTADDDTLAAAQAMGTQQNEDTEHPEELNVARDVDKAEENLRRNH